MAVSRPNPISRIRELSSSGKWLELFSHYNELRRTSLQVTDPWVLSSIFKASSRISPSLVRSFQACVIKLGLASSSSVANSALDFYFKCKDCGSAMTVFRSMESRDSISWNILIHGLLDMGDWEKGLQWFKNARAAEFEPNVSTLVLVIQACRRDGVNLERLAFHGYVVKSGFQFIMSIKNSLLGMYADTDMRRAKQLFDEMPERDVIAWSVIIGGYVNSEEPQMGLTIFRKMVSEGHTHPDEVTLVSVLKACASVGDLMLGMAVHGFLACQGLDADIFVINSMIDMYFKCRDVSSAIAIFGMLPGKNLVSWNSMLSGLVLNEEYWEALLVFRAMAEEGVKFDEV
ncbi:hypothetical protein SAY86_013971 [Trapa natans]|uniref:Pentatricopeptide repeat-containing protein n=1 Tax=Trapa natans TaxID=22666 RepID=A0AAN7KS99_TRANT|nr:hypothetical protein SAY86_013971 [Trapa natans]